MTVPWFYILALVMTLVLSCIVIIKQYEIKSVLYRNILFLSSLLVYFVFGVSWSFVLFNGRMAWWSILLSILFGIIVSLVIAAILDKSNVNTEISYKPEELVGIQGIITNKLDGFHYLGKLLDSEGTDIIVTIEENKEKGDKFTIQSSFGNEIIAI